MTKFQIYCIDGFLGMLNCAAFLALIFYYSIPLVAAIITSVMILAISSAATTFLEKKFVKTS